MVSGLLVDGGGAHPVVPLLLCCGGWCVREQHAANREADDSLLVIFVRFFVAFSFWAMAERDKWPVFTLPAINRRLPVIFTVTATWRQHLPVAATGVFRFKI